MKKLFVSVLAIASMVACMNDEIVSVQKGNPIAFDSFVENATRVGYNSGNLDGFDVWAFMDSTDGVILKDEDVEKDGQGKYSYTNTQYWLPGHTYYFAALAPMESANVTETLATGDAALKGLGTVTFTNLEGTEDLLYAATSVTASDEQGPVKFQFDHLLSKVKFSFKNSFTSDRYSFEVCDIKMTAPKSGTIDLTEGEYAWDNVSGEITLNYGNTGKATLETQETATVSPADERLTIPAGATQEYIVTFVIKLYVNDITEPAMVYNKKTKISGLALEPGKAYNFAAEINQTTLKLDAIEFDAEVDEWIEENQQPAFKPYTVEVAGTNYDDFATAVTAAMDQNAPVKFFQHVVIDADDTITVPAGDTLSLELNGYTLTGVTDQTGSNRNMFDVRGTMNVNGAPLTRAAAKGDGSINIKHTGTNMGWNHSTNVFNVTAGGVLNLENVVSKNLGGSDMAFVAHLNNWGECTLNVDHCTLESTYIAVRLFNSGHDMNNVTIANTELKGKYCFWVHNYKGAGDSAGTDATLNLAIYNPEQNNTFNNTGYAPVLFGFANPIYFDAYGNKIIAEGLAISSEGDYTVTSAEGLKTLSEIVNADEDNTEPVDIVLGGDIDLSAIATRAISSNFSPIGNKESVFTGTFDGQGYTISNLVYENDEDDWYIGLFGNVKNATIKNINIKNAFIHCDKGLHVAALVGNAEGNTVIENVNVTGDVKVYGDINNVEVGRIGVIVGGNYGTHTIKNITINVNEGSFVQGNSSVGGVAGQLQGVATFENVTSNIDVRAARFFAGGIIGLAPEVATFTNCSTSGDITLTAGTGANSPYRLGGIVGGWADNNRTALTLTGCSYEGTLTSGDVTSFDLEGYVGRGYSALVGAKTILNGKEYVYAGNGEYYYVGKIVEAAGQKAVIFTLENGVKAVSVAEKNLKGMDWQDAMNWAAGLGEGWALASMQELNAIYDLRCELNDVLEADNTENALFWEGDELYIKNGSVYYACYMSCDEAPAGELDPQGVAYWENQVFLKYFNDLGYRDYLYSSIDCINKYAPLRDNYFARGVYAL